MGEDGRVFVRGLTSETYSPKHFRRRRLSHPRVRDGSVVVDDGSVGRLFKHLGYDTTHDFEDAPEYAAEFESLRAERKANA